MVRGTDLHWWNYCAIIVVVIVVAVVFMRKGNAEYYDDWGDEEDYEDE